MNYLFTYSLFTIVYSQAYVLANKALKEVRESSGLSVESIDNAAVELQEEMEIAEEINNSISTVKAGTAMEESEDLMDELKKLEEEVFLYIFYEFMGVVVINY